MKPRPNVSIELLKSISTQKAHKTWHKQDSKLHYLGTNQKVKMVVKGISRKIFQRIALESGPIVHLGGGPMTVWKNDPAIRLGE